MNPNIEELITRKLSKFELISEQRREMMRLNMKIENLEKKFIKKLKKESKKKDKKILELEEIINEMKNTIKQESVLNKVTFYIDEENQK